jgi:hypothetical protein
VKSTIETQFLKPGIEPFYNLDLKHVFEITILEPTAFLKPLF